MYCPKCGYKLQNLESKCPKCLVNLSYNTEMTTTEKLQKTGEMLETTGKTLSSCGCLLTLLVTIPILIILILFL